MRILIKSVIKLAITYHHIVILFSSQWLEPHHHLHHLSLPNHKRQKIIHMVIHSLPLTYLIINNKLSL